MNEQIANRISENMSELIEVVKDLKQENATLKGEVNQRKEVKKDQADQEATGEELEKAFKYIKI